jgi:hypothetical protein
MAIITGGPFKGFNGTYDGITYYQLKDGTTVAKKKNSPSTKPPTEKQLSVMIDTKLVSEFMKPFKSFIDVGYALAAEKVFKNPHNVMVSHIRKDTLEGESTERKINLSKLLVTKGDLPSAIEIAAEVTDQGLAVNWSTELVYKESHHSDQVMMLAYFPELKETVYVLSGAPRYTGHDLLPLKGINKGYTAEVYISFITDHHKRISNSVYLGQFNW